MLAITLVFIFVAGLILFGYALHTYQSWFALRESTEISRATSQHPDQYQIPPLKIRTSTRMVMGMKRLDESNWLTIDAQYLPEHAIRQRLLTTARTTVIACLPLSHAACHEALDLAVSFLTSRFPDQFSKSWTLSGPVIHNHMTGETFPIGSRCRNPLEVAALLAMEDFNILMKDPNSGDYLLQASATLFPAGWKLQERIGTSLASLHAPVPGWNEKLGAYVNRYFDHLSPRTAMERTSLFIQTTNDLFQDAHEDDQIDVAPELKLENITIRRERQTFTRLPKSNAVLFTVRTYMTPFLELGDEELKALRSQIWAWGADLREYKGWRVWGEMVEEWCEGRLGKQEPGDVTKMDTGCPV